ncbi:MAG: hypothetical protein CMC55_04085 [Flavobacteriaceae bacterium]|uniref:YncE family protein n=1 Tax=Bizionia echini TaxID=649333 RepID=UPI000C8F7C5F|nr:hypothetical protein [Flavobacteriaceae bacterium]
MKHVIKFLTFSLLFACVLTSCSSDDDNFIETPTTLGEYDNGILVSAEGGSAQTGSVSYISNAYSTIENTIFSNTNAEDLGTYVQSVGFNGATAYIIVDNNNIHVVNRYTFLKEATITTGLNLPRFMVFSNGKGYVTNWGDGFDTTDDFVAVINLETNSVESTIPMAEGPEQMVVYANKLYVSHKGGYNTNNIISVVDLETNVVSNIVVNDVPDEMIVNNARELIVLCKGNPSRTGNETEGSITKIDLSTDTVSDTFTFADGVHPSLMSYSNGNLYFTANNAVYKMADFETTLPTTPIINLGSITTYGMAVKADKLYVTDAKDYNSLGDFLVYDLNSNIKIHTFEVGLVPSKIYFN